MPYGRTILPTSIAYPTRVSADGNPMYKAGGITLDFTTLTAASGSDTTLPDGSVVKANNQFLRYGQVMTKITTATSETLTSTATSGAFTISLVRPDTGQTVKTASIAFNASAATIQAAVAAVMGPSQVGTFTGGPLNTTPVVMVFNQATVPLVTITDNTLAGGTLTPTLTVAGLSAGKFGPYDPNATDGRQNLTRGECYILDELWLLTPAGSQLPGGNEITGGLIEGGLVFLDRILQSGVAAVSLAIGPTKANLLAAFPVLRFVEN